MAIPTLHTRTVHRARATINRVHMLFHFTAILALLYYRISHLLNGDVPLLPWGLITASELIFTSVWFFSQSFRWRPVTRSVYPENLPGDEDLPAVDVFVCTVDPKKEPIVDVMNTVLSAMALDYPPEKIAVYLSDDGGCSLTLYAIKEACSFARTWVPFCRKYGLKTRSPEGYFSPLGDDERLLHMSVDEFEAEEEQIKSSYELFKKKVEKANGFTGIDDNAVHDRPPLVEVIHDNRKDGENTDEQTKLPLLVYVAREKRPSHPHNFKAGALNALLRVSGLMSNAPYLLVLDCDMYCNDPTSARQAMCFHLDPKMSSTLGFVQYPQMFYNVSKNDIYDGAARSAFKTKWQGMDGLNGPAFTGTGYYLKKNALYGRPYREDEYFNEAEKNFGFSSKFIASLNGGKGQDSTERGKVSDQILEEAKRLATCTFEKNTKWGTEIGYSYGSLLESTMTGYMLHTKGWRSTYLYPKRPGFLGCTTIDMKDGLVQLMKWSSGSVKLGLSSFCPLTYGLSRMPFIHTMCYAYLMLSHIWSFALLIYGTIPQLCLSFGIPLFPKVSNPQFALFAAIYASSLLQHLYEVLSSGGTIRTWWNEQRIFMIKLITGCLFGCVDVLLKWIGIAKVNFRLTNKAIDKEKMEKYEKGKFDLQGADMFMVPLRAMLILNLVCLFVGMKRVIIERNFDDMFGQIAISTLFLVSGYPILEGLLPRKTK